jgi:hypothetical protein
MESNQVCTTCGCRFHSVEPQRMCWDCMEERHHFIARAGTIKETQMPDPETIQNALGEICKCPICGRSHIKLERS